MTSKATKGKTPIVNILTPNSAFKLDVNVLQKTFPQVYLNMDSSPPFVQLRIPIGFHSDETTCVF